MRNHKSHTITMLLAAILFMFSSCKKGDQGQPGTNGTNGTNGNANVESTTFTNQGLAYVAANSDYEINLSVPGITQSVLNTGLVMVYVQSTTATNGWITLPATISGIELNVVSYVNQVQIVSNTNSTVLWNVKVVVVPQGSRIANPGIDWNNYSAVQKLIE